MKELRIKEEGDTIVVDLMPGMYYKSEGERSLNADPDIKVLDAEIDGDIVPVKIYYPKDKYSIKEVESNVDAYFRNVPGCSSCERNYRVFLEKLREIAAKAKAKGIKPTMSEDKKTLTIDVAPEQSGVEQSEPEQSDVEQTTPEQSNIDIGEQRRDYSMKDPKNVVLRRDDVPKIVEKAREGLQAKPLTQPESKPLTQPQTKPTLPSTPPPPITPDEPKPLKERTQENVQKAFVDVKTTLDELFSVPYRIKTPFEIATEQMSENNG